LIFRQSPAMQGGSAMTNSFSSRMNRRRTVIAVVGAVQMR
jgi:hypothetical protein